MHHLCISTKHDDHRNDLTRSSRVRDLVPKKSVPSDTLFAQVDKVQTLSEWVQCFHIICNNIRDNHIIKLDSAHVYLQEVNLFSI